MASRLATVGLALALTLSAARADAFCGFYVGGADTKLFNDATNVVLMREGTRTVLSMQNSYQGPPANFAMVVPVPVVLQKENVKTLPRDVFDRVDRLAAPRLVEYWEQDPCPSNLEDDERPLAQAAPGARASGAGKKSEEGELGVTIEARFTVGEYEIVILSAQDSSGLDTWLRQSGYKIPAGAEPLLRPYVQTGSKFFVAKVDVTKVRFENGRAVLSPLRFHYDTEQFSLPVRLGLVNSAGTQDLLVHILAKGRRFEVANYNNVAIPTNLDVDDRVRDRFAAFYASLFDRTVEKNPGSVVTEYSWDANSCDPCPTPALSPGELATLGLDVLPPAPGDVGPSVRLKPAALGGKGDPLVSRAFSQLSGRVASCYASLLAEKSTVKGDVELVLQLSATGTVQSVTTRGGETLGRRTLGCFVDGARSINLRSPDGRPHSVTVPLVLEPQPSWRRAGGFVLTRLHARYGKDALGEDLVFRAATPIVGGREIRGAGGDLEHGASPSGTNNFQGRYAIRHPWAGPITCQNPRRGVWGGPPAGVAVPSGALPALRLAVGARDASLVSLIKQDVPEIGLLLSHAPLQVAAPDSSVTPAAKSPAPPSVRPGGSCGACLISGADDAATAPLAALGVLALATALRRRRGGPAR